MKASQLERIFEDWQQKMAVKIMRKRATIVIDTQDR